MAVGVQDVAGDGRGDPGLRQAGAGLRGGPLHRGDGQTNIT